jgi:hypothetical protein
MTDSLGNASNPAVRGHSEQRFARRKKRRITLELVRPGRVITIAMAQMNLSGSLNRAEMRLPLLPKSRKDFSLFMNTHSASVAIVATLLAVSSLPAEVKVLVDRNDITEADRAFRFKSVPPPAKNDLATDATFSSPDGRRDPNGGNLDRLHDGKLPTEEDQPSGNFFFSGGSAASSGRIVIDLGAAKPVKEVNSYSWHPANRGPQVYRLFASDGAAAGFNAAPGSGVDPLSCGWKKVADVDSHVANAEAGGQYGVSVRDTQGSLGSYRYFLFDIAKTAEGDPFANTFFSEIDVNAPNTEVLPAAAEVERANWQLRRQTENTKSRSLRQIRRILRTG